MILVLSGRLNFNLKMSAANYIRSEQTNACFLCTKKIIQFRCTDCDILICPECKRKHLGIKNSNGHHITRVTGWERRQQP